MPHSCHPAFEEKSSSAAQSWTSNCSTACAMIQPLMTSYFSTILHLVRLLYKVTKCWWWKKVVQIVQTSICFVQHFQILLQSSLWLCVINFDKGRSWNQVLNIWNDCSGTAPTLEDNNLWTSVLNCLLALWPLMGSHIPPQGNAPSGRADRVLVKTGADKGY